MKKSLSFLLLLALLMTAVLGVQVAAAEAGKEIVIGLFHDLSGTMSVAGNATVFGAQYAVDEINEAGGINGFTLKLVHYDTRGSVDESLNVYNRLVDEDNAVAVIGPSISNIGIALAPVATEKKVPIVSHFMDERATRNEKTGETYPYVFLAQPSCGQQAEIEAQYALKQGVKTAAIFYDSSNSYSYSHAVAFRAYMEANGASIVAEETFGADSTDYSAQLTKIAALAPDAVYIPNYAPQNAIAYTQIRALGYEGMIAGNNTYAPPFNTLVEGTKIENLFFVFNVDFTKGNAKVLGDAYQAHFNAAPQFYAAFGYDNVKIIANALAQIEDPTDPVALKEAIETKTTDVECASGTITINPETHRPTGMGVYIAKWDEAGTAITLEEYVTAD